MRPKAIYSLLKATVTAWLNVDAARVAAALAFYTLLSMAPLVVLSISIAGMVLGENVARDHLIQEVGGMVGPQAASALRTVVANAHEQVGSGVLGTIVGLAILLIGASAVFGELQYALDTIWGVKPKPGLGFKGLVRERLFSFSMVVAVAFLLLVSLIVSTVLTAMGRFVADSLPGGATLWQIINFVASLVVTSALFATIFKVVPDVDVRWRDVWPGALFTAVLFSAGRQLLGYYLGTSSVASSYGAAGSVVALVVWVYYSAQLVFLGAEFTRAFVQQYGREIKPAKNAVPIEQTDDTKQQPADETKQQPADRETKQQPA
jgi:membrane protein